jgi:hypothetical protein
MARKMQQKFIVKERADKEHSLIRFTMKAKGNMLPLQMNQGNAQSVIIIQKMKKKADAREHSHGLFLLKV